MGTAQDGWADSLWRISAEHCPYPVVGSHLISGCISTHNTSRFVALLFQRFVSQIAFPDPLGSVAKKCLRIVGITGRAPKSEFCATGAEQINDCTVDARDAFGLAVGADIFECDE